MQKLLDDNDILMYLTLNELNSVVAESFIRDLKGKIYKKMTANNSKSYLVNLNESDEYNTIYYRFIGNKNIHGDYSALSSKNKSSHKSPKFKVGDRVRITKYKNIYYKGYTENGSKEIFAIDSVLKTNWWTYNIRNVNGETIVIISFYEKELLSIL